MEPPNDPFADEQPLQHDAQARCKTYRDQTLPHATLARPRKLHAPADVTSPRAPIRVYRKHSSVRDRFEPETWTYNKRLHDLIITHSFQGSFFLRISHGYVVDTRRGYSDPLVTLIEKAAQEFYIATRPGAWLVDIFPSSKPIRQIG